SFFFNLTPATDTYTLSLHDALPISAISSQLPLAADRCLLTADCWRSHDLVQVVVGDVLLEVGHVLEGREGLLELVGVQLVAQGGDRKSTRLNSSHRTISYAVFCLKK